MNPFKSFFQIIRLKFRHRKLKSNNGFLATFRASEIKPPVVQSRPFELFYHNRTLWVTLQIIVLGLLGLWTIRNYLHFFRSL